MPSYNFLRSEILDRILEFYLIMIMTEWQIRRSNDFHFEAGSFLNHEVNTQLINSIHRVTSLLFSVLIPILFRFLRVEPNISRWFTDLNNDLNNAQI